MYRGTDDRGVSEVVGFILVFGMLVISFTVYQGIVVPDQNRQAEFQHNQAVQGDLQDLRNAIVRTAATGSGEAVSVALGATYPDRTIAMNLGVSAGAVRTLQVGDEDMVVDNARAVGDNETADYLDGSSRRFSTRSIFYTPVYSFYSSAPATVYENTVLFNRFESVNLTVTDQSMIDGRRITLVTVNGSLSRAERGTVSIGTDAISVSANRVAVTNETDGGLNITVPTTLSAATWQEILADEMSPEGHVEAVTEVPGARAVNVTLAAGVTYDLRLARVGVGGATDTTSAEYLTIVSGNGSTVVAGGTTTLVVEVRDRYNNPVSGVTVDVSGGASNVSTSQATTDASGQASFRYTAPSSASTGRVTESFSISDSPEARENVTFTLNHLNVTGAGGAGGGTTTSASQLQGTVSSTSSSGTAVHVFDSFWDDESVYFDVSNTGGDSVNVTAVRVDAPSVPSASELTEAFGTDPWEHEISIDPASGTTGSADDVNQGTIELGEQITLDSPATIDPGSDATVYLAGFSNGANDRDMADETVEVTFYFDDGTQKTITVNT